MRITVVSPSPAPGVTGNVLDCFDVPSDVVELVLCDEEVSFVFADGHSLNTIDYDAGPCPRCGRRDGERGPHTCDNPLGEGDEMAKNAYRVGLLVEFLKTGGYTPDQIADALAGNSDAMAEIATRVMPP